MARWIRALFVRPAYQYATFALFLFLVAAWGSFALGAGYASAHQEKTRYRWYLGVPGALMMLSLVFFVGVEETAQQETSLFDTDAQRQHCVRSVRIGGVVILGMGGLLAGFILAFFTWLDGGTSVTTQPPPTPRSTSAAPTLQVNSNNNSPSFAMICYFVHLVLLAAAITARWCETVLFTQYSRASLAGEDEIQLNNNM